MTAEGENTVKGRLHHVAREPTRGPDIGRSIRRARRLHRSRVIAGGAAAAIVLVGIGVLTRGGGNDEIVVGDTGDAASTTAAGLTTSTSAASTTVTVGTTAAPVMAPDPTGPTTSSVPPARTFDELEAIQQRMVRDRTALQQGTPPPDMPAAIIATGGAYDLDINRETMAIIVFARSPSDELRTSFEQYYGARVELIEGGSGPAQP